MVMKSSDVYLFFPLLLHITPLFGAGFVPKRDFFYMDFNATWKEAEAYCESIFTKLATVRNRNEAEILLSLSGGGVGGGGWIGLYRGANPAPWTWFGPEPLSYTNWGQEEPNSTHNCVFQSNKVDHLWEIKDCDSPQSFFCYDTNYIFLIKENKTWEEALEHCRGLDIHPDKTPSDYRNHRYDLVSLTSRDKLGYASKKVQEALTDQVWTSLRFLGGRWMWMKQDKQVKYDDLPVCPAQWQHCGTLPKDNTTQWDVRDCMEKRNFLCS